MNLVEEHSIFAAQLPPSFNGKRGVGEPVVGISVFKRVRHAPRQRFNSRPVESGVVLRDAACEPCVLVAWYADSALPSRVELRRREVSFSHLLFRNAQTRIHRNIREHRIVLYGRRRRDCGRDVPFLLSAPFAQIGRRDVSHVLVFDAKRAVEVRKAKVHVADFCRSRVTVESCGVLHAPAGNVYAPLVRCHVVVEVVKRLLPRLARDGCLELGEVRRRERRACSGKHRHREVYAKLVYRHDTFAVLATLVAHVKPEELTGWPRYSFEQGTANSFYYSEEPLSYVEHSRNIRISDRGTLSNLLTSYNGYTLSTGVLSSEMHTGIVSIPLDTDERMTVGYIMHNERKPSELLDRYIEELHRIIGESEGVTAR